MTFCSLGELCESTFNCNNQMSYFCTECTYSDSFSSVALCFVCPPRGSFTASLCSVLSWGARRHLVDDSRFCSISCPCWGLGKKSNGLRCFFLLASFQLLALVFKQKDAMDEAEGRAACVSANYILAKTHASLNSIMISNNVIGDIQASRKSTGDECSIIQRHERTHYHHVIMTWCLLWIMLIGFDSFGLLVFCACRLASGVVVLSSVWVRYHALLECSCLVRFSISCTACWELFCFGQFVFWYFFKNLVIVSNARRRSDCNIQMSYFALSGLILILFPAPCSVCGTLYVFSSSSRVVTKVLVATRASRSSRSYFARTRATRIPCREPMFSPSPELCRG